MSGSNASAPVQVSGTGGSAGFSPFAPATNPGEPNVHGTIVAGSAGVALPLTAGAGFLVLTLNGVDVRLPLFLPGQVSG